MMGVHNNPQIVLRDINGGKIAFSTQEEVDAYLDFLADKWAEYPVMALPEPDPEQYAMMLPGGICQALIDATRCQGTEFAGHLEIPRGPHEREMFAMGITSKIGKKHRIVSHFGLKLRRVLLRDGVAG